MMRLLYTTLAFLTAVGPHFFLPLAHMESATGALVPVECEWSYHPEILPALLLLVVALFGRRFPRLFWCGVAAGLLTLTQGVLLAPFSAYIGTEHYLLRELEQTALRSHTGLRFSLLVLGTLAAGVSAWFLIIREPRSGRRLRPASIARATLRRAPFRTAALAALVALSVATLFGLGLGLEAMRTALRIGAGRLGADLMVVPREEAVKARRILLSGYPSVFYMPRSAGKWIRKLPGVDAVTEQTFLLPTSLETCCITDMALVVGFDPVTDFTVRPWLDYAAGPDRADAGAVVGYNVRYYPGQSMAFFGETFRVTASLRPTGIGYFDHAVFIPLETTYRLADRARHQSVRRRPVDLDNLADVSLRHMIPETRNGRLRVPDRNEVSAIFVRLSDDADPAALSNRIEARFPDLAALAIRKSSR